MATQYGSQYGQGYAPYSGGGFHDGDGAGFRDGGTGRPRHRLPAALRAPVEARSWRELAYVLLSLPIGVLLFTYAVTMVSLGAGLLVTFLGIPVLAGALAGCRGLGVLERVRARGLLGLDVAEPEPLRMKGHGPLAWTGAVLKSGGSWRALLYAMLQFPWAVFSFVVATVLWPLGWSLLTYPVWFWVFPMWTGQGGIQLYGDDHHRIYLDNPFEITVTALVGLLITLATPWIVRALTTVDRVLVHGLLGPSRLSARVVELESDRGVVVDTAAADLRRIERDLHDGAQARLVALAMDLGLAKEKLTEDPRAAARMVDEAHGEVKTALQELRDLARGIHPAVLTDHRGHRLLHRLRAAAEHQQAQRGEVRLGGRVAVRGPAAASGHGRRSGRREHVLGIGPGRAGRAAGRGGRDPRRRLAGRWPHAGDGGAALAALNRRARRRRPAVRAPRGARTAGRAACPGPAGHRRKPARTPEEHSALPLFPPGAGAAGSGCWNAGPRCRRRTGRAGRREEGCGGPRIVEDKVRVVIAEDSVLLREGLTRLLTDRGHEVVAGVGDAEALVKTITELYDEGELPDVVVADVRMPPTHTDEGVRAAVRLRKAHPGLGVLVLSQYVEERYATELLAGSSRGVGYLLKDRVAEVREFVDAVVRVAQGGTALDPEVVAQLLGRSRKQDVLAGLTPREREVLGLMAEGRTNSAIARQLVVSDGAVEKHVSNIFLKLGLSPSDGDHRRVLAVLTYLNS